MTFRVAWLAGSLASLAFAGGHGVDLPALRSPVLFRGDAVAAYRDPAAVFQDGWFRLFFTLVRIEDGQPYSDLAWSGDLKTWLWPAGKVEKAPK